MQQESTAAAEEANKNMAIFELERSLEQQARSFTNIINEKDAEILKVQCSLDTKLYSLISNFIALSCELLVTCAL